MIEEILEKARKEYIKISIPNYLVQSGWENLRVNLHQEEKVLYRPLIRYGLVFTSIVFLIFISVVASAQAANPGDKLYPVKILADNAFAKLSGQYEIKVIRRAGEVIDLSNKNDKDINKATKEYQKTLEEVRKEAEKSGQQENFKQTLDNQEEKFKREIEKNPESRKQLEELIKETERTRGEIKGQKDEKENRNDD